MVFSKKKKIWIIVAAVISVITAVILALVCACAIYLGDYYRADEDAIAAFTPKKEVERTYFDKDTIVYAPEGATTGFIFYPGGKVEYTAYIPLMEACAAEGIFCALVEMPFNLAVLDINAADGIQEGYPQIENWYIGGHSLGGSMAASYLANHTDEYEGLILLGSYSTADLSDSGVSVLSVYGSEDRVLNQEKYEENRENLPEDFTETVIEGGCHAYFGVYGAQDGDGTPTITYEQQITQTAKEIAAFVSAS